MDIRLDKETFKALASATRVDVLKLLNHRRHMQSEIAASLNLSVPTVKEHLAALEKAGLVERHDEGRKWKYYSLTKKGKGVLNPEEMKIWIVLATLVFSVVGGIFASFRMFAQTAAPEAKMAMEARVLEADTLAMSAVEQAPQAVNYWPYAFAFVAVISAVLLIYLLYKSAQYKKQLGISLSKK
ncbi:MAG: metalloregulator ArsR/SmtB family transcription factor [Candidatus Woesearchaeota archaeon]